jgi:hypothetical protein
MIYWLPLLSGGMFGGIVAAIIIYKFNPPYWFKKYGGFLLGGIFGVIFSQLSEFI